MVFVKGPIFANMILADEINRTPPKTQAALLEAMQEHQVTAAGVRYPLEEPFFVLATQNPIEMEGTYPLPEAQLDRFMFNVVIDYLPEDDEVAVVRRRPRGARGDRAALHRRRRAALSRPRARGADRRGPRPLRRAPRRRAPPARPDAPDFVNDWVSWGAGTRAAQFLILGAKARALLQAAPTSPAEDIQALVHPTFRHRILVNYRAEAEGVSVDEVIERLLGTREGAALMTAASDPIARAVRGPPRLRMRPTASLIDPQTLMRIKSLELRARIVVEGFCKGLHRSPYHGFSVEFSEYRAYTPGRRSRAISTGSSSPAPIATTSRGSRTRRTCAAICWST